MPALSTWGPATVEQLGIRTAKDKKAASQLTAGDLRGTSWVRHERKHTGERLFNFKMNSPAREKELMTMIYDVYNKWLRSDLVSRTKVIVNCDYDLAKKPFELVDFTKPNVLEKNLLRVALAHVDSAQKGLHITVFRWSQSNRNLKAKWPEPDFTFTGETSVEDRPQVKLTVGSMITSLVRILFPGDGRDEFSELTIEERVIGAALLGVFNADRCQVKSGQGAIHPSPIFSLSGSQPFPDILSVRISGHGDFCPVLCIASEAKRSVRRPQEYPSNEPDARTQLLAGLHTTLIVMIMHYIVITCDTTPEEFQKLPEDKMPPMPEWMYVFGVYYDESAISPFVHFPTLKIGSDGTKTWVLNQVPLDTHRVETSNTELEEAQEALLHRFVLATGLATIRKHTEELARNLGEICRKYKMPSRPNSRQSSPRGSPRNSPRNSPRSSPAPRGRDRARASAIIPSPLRPLSETDAEDEEEDDDDEDDEDEDEKEQGRIEKV